MACDHLLELMGVQKESLRQEIEKDKYYLSEKAGHDVGWVEAERHFINNYLSVWAEGFKECYCNNVCDSTDCKYRRTNEVN